MKKPRYGLASSSRSSYSRKLFFTKAVMRMAASNTTGMMAMGMRVDRPWAVMACAVPCGSTAMAPMAHAAMAHTTIQYWRWANQVKVCTDSPEPLSPELRPAICRSSWCSSAITSMASSKVTMPRMWRFSSQTGIATRSYLVISWVTCSWSRSGATQTTSL